MLVGSCCNDKIYFVCGEDYLQVVSTQRRAPGLKRP